MNLASILGKTLQNHVRQGRVVYRFAHSLRVKRDWAAAAKPSDTTAKTCLLDVRQILFDGPQGRRFHALVTYLVRAGYRVWIVPRLGFLQSGRKCFKWNALHLAEPFDRRTAPARFDLCLTDRPWGNPRADRTVRLTHQTHRPLRPDEVPLPFSLYPDLFDRGDDRDLERYRRQPRRWLVFFGGSRRREDYRSISFFKYLQTVNRHSLLEVALEHFTEGDHERIATVTSAAGLERLLGRSVPGFVLADNDRFRIPVSRWLETLSRASFFIAAPGSRYPMSHNCVEALAVGTIPILEYPQLFQPELRDGINCLVYRGAAGFRETLRRAEAMPEVQRETLRRGAIDYYEQHLTPESVVEKLSGQQARRLHVFPYLTRPAA